MTSPSHAEVVEAPAAGTAAAGGVYLMDPGFIGRMQTISRTDEDRDASAQSRIGIWGGGLKMALVNPAGVGAGNFVQAIGRYAPKHPDRDAHNTLVRCVGELGFPGLVLLAILVANAVLALRQAILRVADLPPLMRGSGDLLAHGLLCGLLGAIVVSLTMTLLYLEFFWWFLALPVCLARPIDNAAPGVLPLQTAKAKHSPTEEDRPGRQRRRGACSESKGVAP